MDTKQKSLLRAIEAFGSQAKLAGAAGVSQQTISAALKGSRAISAELAVAIEKATRGTVRRADLRPDIFSRERAA